MQFEIPVFKDLAEGIDKLVDSLSKLAGHLVSGIKVGKEGMDYLTVKRTAEQLKKLINDTTEEKASITAYLEPSIRYYLDNPTHTNWNRMKTEVAKTMLDLEGLAREIQKSKGAMASERFFEGFFDSVIGRLAILRQLAVQPPPRNEQELKAVERFLHQYGRLVHVIQQANYELMDYVREMERRK
jgi:hypothetical protein